MKAGFTKKRIKNFLTYYTPMLIGIFVLSLIGSWLISKGLTDVKEENKLSLFVECASLKTNISKEVEKSLKEEGLKKFEIRAYSPNNENIGKYYSSFGEYSDYIILTDYDLSDMSDAIKSQNYIHLEDELINAINVNNVSFKYYEYDEIKYAIKIFDKNDDEYSSSLHFNKWIEFNDEDITNDYYLILNSSSVKYHSYTGKGVNDLAVKGLQYLFNY